MKKTTALFLLLITGIFAIRPVIAMHYCHGELHSFSLYQQQEKSSTYSCCHSENPETSPITHPSLTSPWETCCDNALLELATDDYRNNSEPLVLRKTANPTLDGIPLFAHLLRLPIPKIDNNPPVRQPFPPEGLFLQDIDILTYICIYRI